MAKYDPRSLHAEEFINDEEIQETLAILEFKCWYYEQAIQDGTEERVRSLPLDEIPRQYRAIREKMKTVQPLHL